MSAGHDGLAVAPAFVRAWWPVIVMLVCGGLALTLVAWRELRRSGVPPVERNRLMTTAEMRFWQVLECALPEYRVFGQVAMGALLKPVAGLSRQRWWSTYGRFSKKIVDFVVVDAACDVVAIVELDDRSHNLKADAARDAMLGRAGYRVVRFDVRRFPSIDTVRSRFGVDAPTPAPFAASRMRLV